MKPPKTFTQLLKQHASTEKRKATIATKKTAKKK